MKLPFQRIRLFGPVLLYDLVCLARRPRYLFLRTLFPVTLLGLLYLLYQGIPHTYPAQTISHEQMEQMAEAFFAKFMAALFVMALIFTPVYTAGCIAEEKDRRRVDFLFTTSLEDQEIVFGKLFARLANLFCLLLASLPILSFVQFWGGVDPELVLFGYGAVGLTLLSTASFSIYQSVRARKARDAIVSTYLFLLAYFGLTALASVLLSYKAVAAYPLFVWPKQITVGFLVRVINSGNIFFVREKLNEAASAGTHLSTIVPGIFIRYAFFHILVALAFGALAVWQLRRLALHEALPAPKRSTHRWRPERWLRPGDYPMLWKELCIDPGLSFNRAGRILVVLIVMGSFVPAIWNVGWLIWQAWFSPELHLAYVGYWANMLGEAINAWVRQVGIAVACLTILGVAIRAASSVSGEREQETFESLLASPVSVSQICLAKWVGSLWSVRWGFLWLCLVWMLGILMGGLNWVVLPWLVLCWFVYAAFFASLGLWFSARTARTLPATVWTLSATVALSVGQLLPWLLIGMPAMYMSGAWNLQSTTLALRHLALFQVYGMTPPLAFGWLSFRQSNFNFFMSSDYDAFEILETIAAGLLVWLLAARFLWVRACWRLERERIDTHDRVLDLRLRSQVSAEHWAKIVSRSQV